MMKQNFKQPKTTSGPTVRHSVATHILRSLLLLVLMVGVNVNVWGQVSFGKATIDAAPTSTSEQIAMTGSGTGTIVGAWYQGTANFTNGGQKLDGKWFVKLSSEGKIKIRVVKGSVVAGDILRVEAIDIYKSSDDSQTLGFQVEGSNGTVGITETDNAIHTLDYTLAEGDIRVDPDDSDYDYIQFNRNNNSGCGYHSVEILTDRLTAENFKVWSDINGNSSTGGATGGAINTSLGTNVAGGGTVFGDGNVYFLNYVNVKGGEGAIMPDATALIIEGDPNLSLRLLFNRKIDNGQKADGNLEEETVTIPASGKLNFDISSYDVFHLNAIKTGWGQSGVVNSIKLSNEGSEGYTVTWDSSLVPTGCDAWFTIGSDETKHKESVSNIPSGTSVTFHGTDSGDDHKMINGWNNPGGSYWGWGPTKTVTVTSNISVSPDFQNCFRVFAEAENGATATVNTSGKHFQKVENLSFSTTVPDGYTFDGWYNGSSRLSGNNPYSYGTYQPGNGTDDLTLTAKFNSTGTDGTVTYSSENNEHGTVTATITSGSVATAGTTVTFTATPAAGKVFWRWQDYYDGKWHDIAGAPATYEKRIDGNFTIRAIFSDPKTFTAASNGSYYGTVKITKDAVDQGTSYDSAPYPQGLKFVATPKANYSFVAWYSSDTFAEDKKVSTDAEFNFSGTSGNTDIKNNGGTLYAKFVRSGDKVTPKPDCGGKYFDQSKLVAGGGVTLNVSGGKGTITTGAGGGYVSFFFEEGYDLSEINKWTVGCQDAASGNVAYVAFCKNGASITDATFYSGAADRTLEDNHKSKLTSVDEIRIGFKESTTTTIDFFYLETKPDVKYKKPTLASPTTNDMLVFEGETLNLRITDTNGYWREYTNGDYDVTKTDRIKDNEYSPSYDFAELPNGDYYFGIKHGGNCKLGHYHTTELVKVHVKVRKAINKVEVNGTERMYDVYAPAGINGEVGVVFSLHGASNDYDNGRVDFNDIADAEKTTEKKFVVVYPRGLMRQLRGTERGWETYTESNTEDVEFFKAIVTELKKTYTVDDKRIYLAGFSNGGMMAYKAAHQAGDFFAAFASVGGFPVNESHLFHAGKQPTPFIHIQGEDDGVFPSSDYDVSTIIHNMVYRNGAQFNPWDGSDKERVQQDGGMISLTEAQGTKDCHSAETGGADYFFYKIKGLGHWCSKDWTGDGVDDIAATMWTFFNKTDKVKSLDQTLKFKVNADSFWDNAAGCGFDNVNTGTSVLSYGGHLKTNENKNVYHSLQFDGGINGKPHFLKLNVQTNDVHGAEIATDYFLVKLTKTGESTPVFAKRYQAGRGQKDLYINFSALPGFNEYKLEITKSSESLDVKVHGVEFHTGRCDDWEDSEGKKIQENPTFFFDVEDLLSEKGMKPIYQPIYDKSYDGIAKEYLPIADLAIGSTVELNDGKFTVDKTNVTTIPSTLITAWTDGKATLSSSSTGLFNLAHSNKGSEDKTVKSNNAYIYVPEGGTLTYPIDQTKGINISANGRAEMPEYLNGTRADFPDRGVIAIKVEGTVDFTLLAQNDIDYPGNDANAGRSTLKVYYTNDQMNNELKELKEWWFFGTRHEGWLNDGKTYTDHPDGNSMSPLSVNVRLPQLGKDGTCTLFITYEGRRNDDHTFTHPDGTDSKVYNGANDNEKIWIKGFVIKRPDLKVTIGRTDSKYIGKKYNGEDNTKCTRFGENKPYIWSFENVGFNNTKFDDLSDKKVNVEDGRTYVCGGTDDSMDHLLLYSDAASKTIADKVQFDGRVAGQEHIEFLKPSAYNIPTATDNRCIFDPIQSNGLKVNVTGSGWFKIKCAAPNGKVKMKVYSSTNYGASYINLLREFEVDNTKHPESATGKEEHKWGEYTVYLKGHVNRLTELISTDPEKRRAQIGFWDGDYAKSYDKGAEEILRMSLFVVFDRMDGVDYKEDLTGSTAEPQLNIHELSWLNEEPADYVFQREEDPDLLTKWQAIRRDGNGKVSTDPHDPVILWWKACNDNDSDYPVLTENGNDTYNRLGQKVTQNLVTEGKGVQSPGGYSSTSVPSDAGTYNAAWDIAAPASTNSHTEAAFANRNATITGASPQYVKGSNNTEFDIPVSGSFVRICAMKNTYVVAHVIPEKVTGDNCNIYVLDETGAPIPFNDGDAVEKNKRGYIASNVNGAREDGGIRTLGTHTIRIDFTANAGKEYFIVGNNTSISLARLEVHDWRHKPTNGGKLVLEDNADNQATINAAYSDATTNGSFYHDATLARKLTKNNWISLVLPFSMNEKKFKEVFGENARCIHFSGVDFDSKVIKLTHHYYNMIVAGRPVFVRPDVNVAKTSPLEINDITLQTNTVKPSVIETAKGNFTFTGSYNMQPIVQNDLFINNNQMTYLDIESSSYPGMRSFIKNNNNYDFASDINPSVGAKAMFLEFFDSDEDVPTEIMELIGSEFGEKVVVVTKSTKVYDLNGRIVSEGANINNLPAGIYIANGKKFVVK